MDTAFKIEISAKLKEKNLADSSIKLYLRTLEKLNDNKPLKNLNFLKNSDKIMKSIEHLKPNTVRNYLIAVSSVLGLDKSTKPKQKIYNTYFNLMMNMNKTLKEVEHSNTKSDTQQKNWIDWNDVIEQYNTLEQKVNTFKGKKIITEAEYNTLLQYMILSLYVLLPPRRNEYRDMLIVNKVPKDTTENYLVLDTHQIIFNKYKTAKAEGSLTVDIPVALQDVLSVYLKFHPGKKKGQFLMYADGTLLDKVNSITRVLNKVFSPKRVSSSMLRHSYLSYKYGKVQESQKTDAELMGHSLSMAKDYIKE